LAKFSFLRSLWCCRWSIIDQNPNALTRNRPGLARLDREHEQAEPDDGHRKHGNPDNLNPKGLGHGTLSRMIRLRSKQRNGPEPEAKKPDLSIQAEPSAY
jgi:hypothetical protein